MRKRLQKRSIIVGCMKDHGSKNSISTFIEISKTNKRRTKIAIYQTITISPQLPRVFSVRQTHNNQLRNENTQAKTILMIVMRIVWGIRRINGTNKQ